jgi:CheY-like chemotaxis protein
MTKIFLFMENPQELTGFETLLRKLGFDTISVNREAQMADRLLGFYPDLVILPGRGGAVDGLKLATKLRKTGYQRSLALTWPIDSDLPDEEIAHAGADGVLAYPIDPENALGSIAELTRQDPLALLTKFEKLQRSSDYARASSDSAFGVRGSVFESGDGRIHVSGSGSGDRQLQTGPRGGVTSSVGASNAVRRERNRLFLAQAEGVDTSCVLPKGVMAQSVADLTRASAGEAAELARLHDGKKAFVKRLFQAAKTRRAK